MRLAAVAAFCLFAAQAPAQPDPTTFELGTTLVPAGQGGGTVFRVWAPNATTANVPGQFNSWNTSGAPMASEGSNGIWSVWVPTANEGQEFKFLFDGATWRVDPRIRNSVNSNGNGIIADDGSDYAWQANSWVTPDRDQMVIYEMHVGTFSGNGDGVPTYPATLRQAVDTHVADLTALGVNMVEIMPINEFPGGVSWGYNPVHLFAPESNYGDPDDLRYFVDTMHANGIGVIIDVVYNHIGPSDNNLWDFDGPQNIYFFGNNCQGDTPWGSTRPKYTEPQVRDLILDSARSWMSEYRMDGLRVDATSFMRGYCGESGEGWLLMGDITDAVRGVNPRAIVIAEELPNVGAVTTPRNQGGAGYDAQWSDPFNDSFRSELRTLGSTGDINMGTISFIVANSGFGRPNSEAIKYVESHDETNTDQRLNKVIDFGNPFGPTAIALSKVVTGLTLLSPGIPMLFQGQEFLEDKPFNDGAGDRIWWGFLNTYSGIRDFYGTLGNLRTTRGSLRSTSGIQVIQVNEGANVIAFQRFDLSGDVIFVIANFSPTDFGNYQVGVPSPGQWQELANSDATAHLGGGGVNGTLTATSTPRDGMPATLDLRLPPRALLVFSQFSATTPQPSSARTNWNLYE